MLKPEATDCTCITPLILSTLQSPASHATGLHIPNAAGVLRCAGSQAVLRHDVLDEFLLPALVPVKQVVHARELPRVVPRVNGPQPRRQHGMLGDLEAHCAVLRRAAIVRCGVAEDHGARVLEGHVVLVRVRGQAWLRRLRRRHDGLLVLARGWLGPPAPQDEHQEDQEQQGARARDAGPEDRTAHGRRLLSWCLLRKAAASCACGRALVHVIQALWKPKHLQSWELQELWRSPTHPTKGGGPARVRAETCRQASARGWG
mmetsp:Transcript_106920/g.297750  ORF Transcript_106920/g.297750 Transcript_106920/m.297750 type:complete len:260 (+) Transcript_106920:276-1055(+)